MQPVTNTARPNHEGVPRLHVHLEGLFVPSPHPSSPQGLSLAILSQHLYHSISTHLFQCPGDPCP